MPIGAARLAGASIRGLSAGLPLAVVQFRNGRDSMRIEPAFLFDLDGTLVDSVYQQVLAWKQPLDAEGIELAVWRFTNQLPRETGMEIKC